MHRLGLMGILLTAMMAAPDARGDCLLRSQNGPHALATTVASAKTVTSDAAPPGGVWRLELPGQSEDGFVHNQVPITINPVERIELAYSPAVGVYRVPDDASPGDSVVHLAQAPGTPGRPLTITDPLNAADTVWSSVGAPERRRGQTVLRDGPEPCLDTFPPPPADVAAAIASWRFPKKAHFYEVVSLVFANGTGWVVGDDPLEGYVLDVWWVDRVPGVEPTFDADNIFMAGLDPIAVWDGEALRLGVSGAGSYALRVRAVDVRTGAVGDTVDVDVDIPETVVVQACGCRTTEGGAPGGLAGSLLLLACLRRRRGTDS